MKQFELNCVWFKDVSEEPSAHGKSACIPKPPPDEDGQHLLTQDEYEVKTNGDEDGFPFDLVKGVDKGYCSADAEDGYQEDRETVAGLPDEGPTEAEPAILEHERFAVVEFGYTWKLLFYLFYCNLVSLI